MKRFNEVLTAKEAASYLNFIFVKEDFTSSDVIFFAIKGSFPAYNYVRFSGISINKFQRPLYKINGIKGFFESLFFNGGENFQDIGNEIINNRNLFTNEECAKCIGSYKSLIRELKTEIYDDPRYELDFATTLYLNQVIRSDDNPYEYFATLQRIETKYSSLNKGIFNGLVRSSFTEELGKLYLPSPSLVYRELYRLTSLSDPIYSTYDGIFELNIFNNVFFDISMQFQKADAEEEIEELESEGDFEDLFYFLKSDIANFCKSLTMPDVS